MTLLRFSKLTGFSTTKDGYMKGMITKGVEFEGHDSVLRVELGLGHGWEGKNYGLRELNLLLGAHLSQFVNSLKVKSRIAYLIAIKDRHVDVEEYEVEVGLKRGSAHLDDSFQGLPTMQSLLYFHARVNLREEFLHHK